MPKDVEEKDIREGAKVVKDASTSFIIIQLSSQFILKGSIKKLIQMYFALQLLKAITIYNIEIPPDSLIYIEEL